MLQPQHEALKTGIEKVLRKRDYPMDDVKVLFGTTDSGLHVSVGVNLPHNRVPALRKALRRILMDAFHSDEKTLQFTLTNGSDEWFSHLDALKNVSFPEREITLKGDWTLGRIRNWISRNAPDGLDILAVDIVDVKGSFKQKRLKRRNYVFARACLGRTDEPEEVSRTLALDFVDAFEAETKVPMLLEIVPDVKSAREFLKNELHKTKLTKEDIPALKALLADRLRYRTPSKQPYERMIDGDWFRIDGVNVLKPEDLLWLEQTDQGLVVHVAIPDITATRNGNGNGVVHTEPMVPEKPTGFFEAAKPRLAWVIDFAVKEDKLELCKGPYRGLVDCKRDFTPRSRISDEVPAFDELRALFKNVSSEGVVTKLMELTGEAVGALLKEKNFPFLTRKKSHDKKMLVNPNARDILCVELNRLGVPADRADFASQVRIAALMRCAMQKGAPISLLSALASALRGEPIVCVNEPGRCLLKPERGSLEQVNQWILAAYVANDSDAAPPIVREVLYSPEGISAALQKWEAERHVAKFLKMLICNLNNEGRHLNVRVRHVTDEHVLCESTELKRLGYINGPRPYKAGASLSVTLGGFNLDEGRYEFFLQEPKSKTTKARRETLPDASTVAAQMQE